MSHLVRTTPIELGSIEKAVERLAHVRFVERGARPLPAARGSERSTAEGEISRISVIPEIQSSCVLVCRARDDTGIDRCEDDHVVHDDDNLDPRERKPNRLSDVSGRPPAEHSHTELNQHELDHVGESGTRLHSGPPNEESGCAVHG